MAAYGRNTPLSQIISDPNATLGDLSDALEDAGYSISKRDKDKSKISLTLKEIKGTIVEMDTELMHTIRHWVEVDKAASKYAKTLAMTKTGMDNLRKSSMKNVIQGRIGYDFGMNAEDLIEAQQKYAQSIGRTIKLGMDDSRTLAAITSVFGDQSDMFNEFDKFGVSMEGVGTHMGKMFSEASKNGISLERYANNVKQGMAIANTYTFKEGLKGMEAMAKRAASIKMDMQQVQSFADAFGNVENAIQSSAKLQVLGGPFAAGADAIGLLNDSLNDLESLEKKMEGFTAGMGTLNKQTGEVDISTFNRLRLKQYAEVTGQDFGKVMEVARRQAMKGEIESALQKSSNYASLDDDFKELIKNTATFKNGEAGVTINGEFKKISDLTANDQQTLIEETRSQSDDIKSIAKDVRSLVDIRTGIKKQYQAVAAQQESIIGNPVKGATRTFADWGMNWPLRGISGVAMVGGLLSMWGTLKGGIDAIKKIWTGGSGSGIGADNAIGRRRFFNRGSDIGEIGESSNAIGKKGNFFKNLFKGGRKTSIPKGGKQILSTAGKSYTQVGTRVFNSAGNEIFGAAKSSVLKGATAKGSAEIGRRGAKRAVTRAAIKVGGKQGAKILGKLAAGAAKGSGLAIVGAVGNVATDMLVDSGKVKKGGGAHTALKVGSTALEGAGAGMALGAALGSVIPGFGTAVGAALGAAVGAVAGGVQMAKIKREMALDNQLSAMGIERKGNYGAHKLKKIDQALQTGQMSNRLRKKLLREGDADIVNAVEAKKKEKQAEKQAKRDKRWDRFAQILGAGKNKFGTAKIEVGTGYFGIKNQVQGKASLGERVQKTKGKLKNTFGLVSKVAQTGVSIIKGKKLDGESSVLDAFREYRKKNKEINEGKKEVNNGPLDVNINGTIKLEAPNGQSFDLLAEIKRNPALTRQLAEVIMKEWNTMRHGAYVDDKNMGVNT